MPHSHTHLTVSARVFESRDRGMALAVARQVAEYVKVRLFDEVHLLALTIASTRRAGKMRARDA
jgi:hypothetical protein